MARRLLPAAPSSNCMTTLVPFAVRELDLEHQLPGRERASSNCIQRLDHAERELSQALLQGIAFGPRPGCPPVPLFFLHYASARGTAHRQSRRLR